MLTWIGIGLAIAGLIYGLEKLRTWALASPGATAPGPTDEGTPDPLPGLWSAGPARLRGTGPLRSLGLQALESDNPGDDPRRLPSGPETAP